MGHCTFEQRATETTVFCVDLSGVVCNFVKKIIIIVKFNENLCNYSMVCDKMNGVVIVYVIYILKSIGGCFGRLVVSEK